MALTMEREASEDHFLVDTWLSKITGFACFSMRDAATITRIKDFPRGLITIKLDSASSGSPDLVSNALKRGFKIISFEAAFEGDAFASRISKNPSSGGGMFCRDSRPEDEPEVIELAEKSFAYDRFHKDERMPKHISDAIKGAWVKSYFENNRATALTIAESKEKVCGFLLTIEADEKMTIDLVAVDSKHRGQGVATQMFRFRVDHSGKKKLRVAAGTQLDNTSSTKLYREWGLTNVGSSVVLHRTELER